MYKIIYMKADFEPWWQFEGWESHIVLTHQYETEEAYTVALEKVLVEFREKFQHEEMRKERFIAFWNDDECTYCEGCDEDTQVYHGIVLEVPVLSGN